MRSNICIISVYLYIFNIYIFIFYIYFNKQQVYIRRSCIYYFGTSETLYVLFRRRSLESVWWWSEWSTVTTTAAHGDTRSLLIAPTVSAATLPGICTTIHLTDLVGPPLSLPHSLPHSLLHSLPLSLPPSLPLHSSTVLPPPIRSWCMTFPNVHVLLCVQMGFSSIIPLPLSKDTVEMYICKE